VIRHVRVLATGGTIATTTDPETGRSAPTLGADVAALAAVDGVDLSVEVIASRPSWSLDPVDMARIASRAVDAGLEGSVDGVVVTHGTTTLEYTAFLTDLFVQGEVPVVLTGAMRRADDPAPDGPKNLRDAIAVAASTEARGHGALVVFAGRIIAGRHAWKANRSQPDAFVDLSGAPLGTVSDGLVSMAGRPEPRHAFTPTIEPHVAFVKLVPGSNGGLIDVALDSDAAGLVVEALPGAGGVPTQALASLKAAADRVPVVIASRAPFGVQQPVPTGGTGEPLKGTPFLSAGGLSAEAAWLLLMVILGQGRNPNRSTIHAAFDAVAQTVSAGPP
jgi:L-asparaginase